MQNHNHSELENNLDLLPQTMQDIVDIIGIVPAIELVKHYGGVGLLIPKSGEKGQAERDLVVVIGNEATSKLMKHYRGDIVYVPKCEQALRVIRDKNFRKAVNNLIIEKKISQDRAFFELCPAFNITTRTAFNIMQRKIHTVSHLQHSLI